MKKNYSKPSKLLKITFIVIGLLFFEFSFAQNLTSTEDGNWHQIVWSPSQLPQTANDVTISNSIIIEQDKVVEINNLDIGKTGSLTVNGTLIVNGSIDMDNNGSYFEMGASSRVIIFGDFSASNKVNVSISSYLIIHGNFTKKGNEGKGNFDVENGNIYIYGDVDGWPNFGSCDTGEDYTGTPQESGSCDYGNEDDFANNPDIPEDIIELSRCYNLSELSDINACEGSSATFRITAIAEVDYKWQRKIADGDWVKVGSNSNSYTSPITKLEDDGNLYRVIVKPKNPANSNCKISISKSVVLKVNTINTWTGTENSNWNNTNNWSCNSLPTLETDVLIPENITSGNYPEITAGTNALAKNLSIENNASVMVTDNWLRIAGSLTNSGALKTETGSISFEGTSAQIIPLNAFENNRIQNLRINNTFGVTSEAIIEITGTLKIETGIFDTGNDLSLISDENQTALIDGSGNGEVIGLVSMQRYLDKAFGYKYFSSPFQNSLVSDFGPFMNLTDPISNFPHFYRYNENRKVEIGGNTEDATGWEAYTNTANVLNIAEGYALNFGTSTGTQTIELTGEVNNGVITARELENNHREYTKGFHLVGNPYPSPIDWNATQGWVRNNIDNGIYFFTASDTNQYTGTYTAYVNGISTGNNNAPNIIPSMQGFFIKVSDSDTKDKVIASFGMDNKVRVTNFEQEFYRSQNSKQKSLIRLEAGFKGAKKKDAMIIYFSPYATPNFEKEMDAHKLMNTDSAVPSFYNLTEDKKELAINAIPFPENKSYKKIPLGIKADENGEMSIDLAGIKGLSSNFNIYLIDHQKSIGQNLSNNTVYNFNIKKGTHNTRFELMFSEEEITTPAIAFNDPFDVEVENGNVLVSLNLEENQKGILKASTITGQILQIKEASGTDKVIFEGITSSGVYIINLQVGKARYAKKIVIKK